ncbi:DUF805 domain-containing protein [Gilvimarinus polysaccharolyticus]|uniref:DUF805 domain-containing protein n=1 Tax=Gilvimarinus polysaccharolyticus TaxID=863921 RepID=UPI0006733764|nr:DUF805 domain-containing protein [Gilvimarinus polysaccharolyticus]
MNYFIDALKKYADFSGRARRKEYWMFILFYLIFYIAFLVVDSLLGTMFLTLIFSLVLLVPSISIAARRLHDTGRTGWWQLIGLIPLIGAIILLVFLVQDSHAENAYGPSPK